MKRLIIATALFALGSVCAWADADNITKSGNWSFEGSKTVCQLNSKHYQFAVFYTETRGFDFSTSAEQGKWGDKGKLSIKIGTASISYQAEYDGHSQDWGGTVTKEQQRAIMVPLMTGAPDTLRVEIGKTHQVYNIPTKDIAALRGKFSDCVQNAVVETRPPLVVDGHLTDEGIAEEKQKESDQQEAAAEKPNAAVDTSLPEALKLGYTGFLLAQRCLDNGYPVDAQQVENMKATLGNIAQHDLVPKEQRDFIWTNISNIVNNMDLKGGKFCHESYDLFVAAMKGHVINTAQTAANPF